MIITEYDSYIGEDANPSEYDEADIGRYELRVNSEGTKAYTNSNDLGFLVDKYNQIVDEVHKVAERYEEFSVCIFDYNKGVNIYHYDVHEDRT